MLADSTTVSVTFPVTAPGAASRALCTALEDSEEIGANVNCSGMHYLTSVRVWVYVCCGTAPLCASRWGCETSPLAHKSTSFLPLRLPRKVPNMKEVTEPL